MPSTFRLDHVVIRVYDLAKATEDYAALGFTVVPGGEHPSLGSRNALIAFEDDTYLELWALGSGPPDRIVPRKLRFQELVSRSPVERHWLPWQSSPEGLVDFALVPSNIEKAIAAASARGLHLEGPLPGERLRPDGQRVAWQLGFADNVDLPFLCADVTPRSLRVPGPEARNHANGATGIAWVIVAASNLDASTTRYTALLGQEAHIQDLSPDEDSEFTLGSTVLALGWARDDGPCAVGFSFRDEAVAGRLFLARKSGSNSGDAA